MGLFNGYPDGTFRPNANISRADYVLVLWRAEGSPEPNGAAAFSDVSAGAYYAKAVAWAYEKGYVNGKGEGKFDPTGSLTRQEAMKIRFGLDAGDRHGERRRHGAHRLQGCGAADGERFRNDGGQGVHSHSGSGDGGAHGVVYDPLYGSKTGDGRQHFL